VVPVSILKTVRLGMAIATGVLMVAPASATTPACNVGDTAPDVLATLYGDGIHFDVYRKGDRVGHHRVRFDRGDGGLIATSELELRIDVLFLPVFRYAYRSVEIWREGTLKQLTVDLNDNGSSMSIEAGRGANGLTVRTGPISYVTPGQIFPTNHWNSAVVFEQRVLNTLTGRVNEVRIEPRGREHVETERGSVAAKRYEYTGDLSTDVWYDDCGRWVKMRFAGRDGSTIEYVCRRCQGSA